MSHRGLFAVLGCAALAAAPRAASAFALLYDSGDDPPRAAFIAPRWDAEPYLGTGLADGIRVAVDAGVARDLALAPDDVPLLELAIEKAFAMWADDVLWFEIEQESTAAVRGAADGAEIDVFTAPGSDPVFAGTPYFGITFATWTYVPSRLLTNGVHTAGFVITGADIFLNSTRLLETLQDYGLPPGIAALALTRLLGHEIGHALGLGHPNEDRNLDYDTDPLNVETVDPGSPFARLMESGNFDTAAILSNRPCGPMLTVCNALFYQALRPDDRLGRDVLYPVPTPEPATPLLGVAALAALAGPTSARRGRSRGSGAR